MTEGSRAGHRHLAVRNPAGGFAFGSRTRQTVGALSRGKTTTPELRLIPRNAVGELPAGPVGYLHRGLADTPNLGLSTVRSDSALLTPLGLHPSK